MTECLGSLGIGNGASDITHTGSKPKEVPAEGTGKATQAVGAPGVTGRGAAALYNQGPKSAAGAGAEHPQALPATAGADAPVRPKHIDQYVHLLPQKTQERAAQVKTMLMDLDEAREKARLLMEAGEHSDAIELWARKATRLDSAVKSIYRELDSEWDKLVGQGRVVVDDLGIAHVVESEESRVKSEESDAAQELTSEQKHRRRELRKFLTDTRRGNGKTREEHVGKWQEAWKEYLTLEPKEAALKDEKILEAMKHYGIEV